jgi:undecaprenyl-diphosphatase
MTSIVTWVVVALVISPSVRNRLRPWLLALALLLAAAIGFTRLALGVHYLSDVLAGWALGAGWLAVTAALFRAWQTEEGRVSPRVGQGLEEHGTWIAPVHDRLLPEGGRTIGRLVGTAALLVALAATLSALAPASSGPLLRNEPVLAGLSAPWTLLTTSVAVSVLALAVSRRRRPALLPVTAVLGSLAIIGLAAAVPGAGDLSWHAAAATAAFGSLAVLLGARRRSRGRWSVLVLPVIVAALSAGSRDIGWPAVLVGGLVGTAWLAACARWQLLGGTPPAPYPEGVRSPQKAVAPRR